MYAEEFILKEPLFLPWVVHNHILVAIVLLALTLYHILFFKYIYIYMQGVEVNVCISNIFYRRTYAMLNEAYINL